jgi:hypothetical protein
MARKQNIPTAEQIAAWHAGGYIVERTSLKAAKGTCRASNVIYPTIDAALDAAARLDRPDSMTFVNYALPA